MSVLKSPYMVAFVLANAIIAYFILHHFRNYINLALTRKFTRQQCDSNTDTTKTLNPPTSNLPYREYTLAELRPYNGQDKPEILIAVGHNIYDVSSAPQFYGPNGNYGPLAGRDASPSLASGRIQKIPADRLQDFEQLSYYQSKEREALNGWVGFFDSKYPQVGTLVPEHTWAGSGQEDGQVGIQRGAILDNLTLPIY